MPEDTEHQGGARPFWSGAITFGLVTIPVNLYPAHRGDKVSLRMLGPNGKPLARRFYSGESRKEMDADEIIRGYEIRRNKFVEIADDELDRLAPERSRDINLRLFVDQKSIPKLYFEHGYILTPDGSPRAYHLLAGVMERTGRTGIATFVMRGKEYLVAISAEQGILRAETMRFPDEIRSSKEIGLPRPQKVPEAQVKKFERLIESRSASSIPADALRNKQAERLLKLVRRKQRGKGRVVATAKSRGQSRPPVLDLLEVLRKSLNASKKSAAGKPASRTAQG